jgi:hypothetical protein
MLFNNMLSWVIPRFPIPYTPVIAQSLNTLRINAATVSNPISESGKFARNGRTATKMARETKRRTSLIVKKADNNSSFSFPSDRRLLAAPPNPPSPMKLNKLKYARNIKYNPSTGAPAVCARYTVEKKPSIVIVSVTNPEIRLCRWMGSRFNNLTRIWER